MKHSTAYLNTIVFLIVLLIGVLSCKKQDQNTVNNAQCDRQYSFSNDVFPIVVITCNNFGCHDGASPNAFPLTTHAEIRNAVFQSNLLEAIKHQTPNPMPRIDPLLPDAYLLNDSIIKIFECWISQGTLNN